MKTSRTYESAMRDILQTILDGQRPTFVDDPDAAECLLECFNRGYLIGMDLERNSNQNVIGRYINPKVTLKGRYFLEARDPDKNSRIALWLSVTSVVITVIFNILNLLCF